MVHNTTNVALQIQRPIVIPSTSSGQVRQVFEEESFHWSSRKIPRSEDSARNDNCELFVKNNFRLMNHAYELNSGKLLNDCKNGFFSAFLRESPRVLRVSPRHCFGYAIKKPLHKTREAWHIAVVSHLPGCDCLPELAPFPVFGNRCSVFGIPITGHCLPKPAVAEASSGRSLCLS